jgi:hypothetical protein
VNPIVPPLAAQAGLPSIGLGDHETPAVVRICQPALRVHDGGLPTHRDEQGIVELLRPRDIVTSDHDMAEHIVLS